MGLDDNVFQDYAAKLLPRAVGYSAALLDYFFRGRLDVDLVEDSLDSALFQLTGTNGSSDALVAGTLTLYADGPMGRRSEVAAVTSVPVQGVQAGEDLFAVPTTFVPPADAERFVAVYKGTLGLEKREGTFPGGVIGKVLGGVRVEELFSDGTRWRLRTPKGVFLLPLEVAEFEEVRWGDGDNLLVARTPFGPDQPHRVAVYEVQRVPNSIELVTRDTPAGPEAQLTKKTEVLFPFGLSLGTTVDFTHRTQLVQRVARVDPRRNVFRWEPLPPFCPACGHYVFDHTEVGPPQIETIQAGPIVFRERFVLRLDLERNAAFATVFKPYVWNLQEVGADALGRPLAVVVVTLSTPASPPVPVPVMALNPQSGAPEAVGQTLVGPAFPPGMNRSLWAVVNLTTGEVRSTAEDAVTIVFEEGGIGSIPDVYEHGLFQFTGGGPNDGTIDGGWSRVTLEVANPRIPTASVAPVPAGQSLAIAMTGWLKGELRRLKDPLKDAATGLGFFDVQPGSFQKSVDLAFDCPTDAGGFVSCHVLRVTDVRVGVARGSFELFDARRSRPAPPGGERLAFMALGPVGRGSEDTLLVWDPGTPSAGVLFRLPLVGESLHLVGPVIPTAAMVVLPEGEPFHIVPLEGPATPGFFPSGALTLSLTLLAPNHLYSARDLRFYRSTLPLQRTVLPAKLADLPDGSNPVGDYHAIRVP